MIYSVEDNEGIRNLVTYTLTMTGYPATGFPDAAAFWDGMARETPKLIILDIMLPGEDGVSILRRLRADAKTVGIPVIMLSAKSAEYDKVESLEIGADDYVTKPFGMMELIARVKAVLRRCEPKAGSPELILGGVRLNRETHVAFAGEDALPLTFREFELLAFLMENAGRAFDRDTILDAVWGEDYFGGARTVDMHVQTLRKKLGAYADQIQTVHGLGYRMGGGDHAQ